MEPRNISSPNRLAPGSSPYSLMSWGTVPPAAVPPAMHPTLYVDDPNLKFFGNLAHNCAQKTVLSGVMGFGLGGLFGLFTASLAYDTPLHVPSAPPPPPPTTTPAAAATSSPAKTTSTAGTTTTTPPTSASAPSPTKPPSIASSVSSALSSSSAKPTLPMPAAAAAAAAPPPLEPIPFTSLPWRQQVAHGFRDMGTRSFSMARNFGKVGALFAGIECGIEGLRARNDITNGVAAGCLTGGILAINAGPQAAAGGCVAFAAFSAAVEMWLRAEGPED